LSPLAHLVVANSAGFANNFYVKILPTNDERLTDVRSLQQTGIFQLKHRCSLGVRF